MRGVRLPYADRMLESSLRQEFPSMSDAETRQKAEDHYYAALDLMADGKLEEAVAAYRKAVKLNPDQPEGQFNLGLALVKVERFDEAAAARDQAEDRERAPRPGSESLATPEEAGEYPGRRDLAHWEDLPGFPAALTAPMKRRALINQSESR